MSNESGYHLSQGLEVLEPKSGPAYPIPCGEWDTLKAQVKQVSTEPWFFHTTGSLLLGAALATFIAIVTGTYSGAEHDSARIIAWAVVAVTGLSGLLCIYFAHKERDVKRQRGADLVTQMELIERRFERRESA